MDKEIKNQFFLEEKKEEISIQEPTRKKSFQKLDYTTIADRLRTVSWSNSSLPTGLDKPVYERSTVPTNRNSRVIKKTHI